jgi:cold shock CspA family protein
MQVPPEITFRNVVKTDTTEALIRENIDKLEKVCDHIMSCRVAVEKPQQFQRSGAPFRVRIDLTVPPGHEIIVTREPSEGELHDGLSFLLRDAFKSARRRLRDLVARQHGVVKPAEVPETVALVSRLIRGENYGFLRTVDGTEEIYFHRNAVLNNDFDRLEPGTGVRFVVQMGDDGLQASTVQIIDKPGVRMSGADEARPATSAPIEPYPAE